MIGILVTISTVLPIFLIAAGLISVLYALIAHIYLSSSRELNRMSELSAAGALLERQTDFVSSSVSRRFSLTGHQHFRRGSYRCCYDPILRRLDSSHQANNRLARQQQPSFPHLFASHPMFVYLLTEAYTFHECSLLLLRQGSPFASTSSERSSPSSPPPLSSTLLPWTPLLLVSSCPSLLP